MKKLFQRIGIDISAAAVTAASTTHRGRWTASAALSEAESLSETIARTLRQAPQGWLATRSIAAIDGASARVRELNGIPPGLTRDEVQSLVTANWSRFFVASFEKNAVSTITRTASSWSVALVDQRVVDAISEGCASAGCPLVTVVVDGAREGKSSDLRARTGEDVEAGAVQRALEMLTYVQGTNHEVVPAAATHRTRSNRRIRMQAALLVCIAGIASTELLPPLIDLIRERAASKTVRVQEAATATLDAQLDSLNRTNAQLVLIEQHRARSVNALTQLTMVERALTDDALIHRFRVDSAGMELSLSAEEISDAIRGIVRTFPRAELASMAVVSEGTISLPRAELRISSAQKTSATRKKRSW